MIWLIGAGVMAGDYVDVLKELKSNFQVISRSVEKSEKLSLEKEINVISGGIDSFLETNPLKCNAAIVAVPVNNLYGVTISLLSYGVKKILLEKPGGIDFDEVKELTCIAEQRGAEVFIGYNRRFYTSVRTAKKMIAKEGGVESFHFEFTEWADSIASLSQPSETKDNWLMANSSHVIDMAFFLGGAPQEFMGFSSGANQLDWHKKSAKYSGAGISDNGATFSYCANWNAPGRWSLEFMTTESRYIFKPMERLSIQRRNSVSAAEVEVDYSLDEKFKPGLFLQVEAFLSDDISDLFPLRAHSNKKTVYDVIEFGGKFKSA
tara:strand:- start:10555 stop:11514 length:960 start_codon:yes stop_codon:yes gene_type:complete